VKPFKGKVDEFSRDISQNLESLTVGGVAVNGAPIPASTPKSTSNFPADKDDG
jgi:hypothetical protein